MSDQQYLTQGKGSIPFTGQCMTKTRERECFKMMPIGYYNYVIGGRLNTREQRERERKRKSLYSSSPRIFFLLIETVHAEMMKRHLGNDYDEFEHNKLMPASCRLLFLLECIFFPLQSVIYFDYLITYVYIDLLKIINISIVYSQLDTEQKKKTGVG